MLQILIVVIIVESILCQHYQHHQQQQHQQQPFSAAAHSHYYLQQHHPTPTPTATTPTPHYNNYGYQASTTTASSFVDLDRFNHHAKIVKDQMNYFHQQEQKNLRNQINSVHQDGSDPHFDFMINTNYTDLEKASEQFVNYGNMMGKQQNMPKVIKITKTVAVKQPVPVPYPVPVVKVIREQVPVDVHHSHSHDMFSHHGSSTPTPTEMAMTTAKSYDFKPSHLFNNYTSYISKYPTQSSFSNSILSSPSPSPSSYQTSHNLHSYTTPQTSLQHKIAESYVKHNHYTSPDSSMGSEYDTRPFYVSTSEKEMIKYIPVPYYVDENGHKHELPTSSSSDTSHETSSSLGNTEGDSYYTSMNKQSHSMSSDVNSGKFQTYTFSYHPPTPVHSTTQPTPTFHHSHMEHIEPQALHATPEAKYYYRQGEVVSVPLGSSELDNTVSSSHHYAVNENVEDSDDEQHIQYKYVYER